MPNSSIGKDFHLCLESDDFKNDYEHLIQAGVPVVTDPHPEGARHPGEEDWSRVVFHGLDGEEIEFRG